jgi:hypothetical protein
MIGHDHTCAQLVELPSNLAMKNRVGYHFRHLGIPQPTRPESGSVHLAIESHE